MPPRCACGLMEGILTEVSNQERTDSDYLVSVELDEDSIGFISQEVDHERRVAIFDLVEQNYFRVANSDQGPYCLHLSTRDRRLVMRIRHHMDPVEKAYELILSMAPFRSIIRDYFMLCESYYDAIRHAPAQQIEAIDMGRRGMHNEGSDLLRERLKDKIELDKDTARRLFTLLCSLHMKA